MGTNIVKLFLYTNNNVYFIILGHQYIFGAQKAHICQVCFLGGISSAEKADFDMTIVHEEMSRRCASPDITNVLNFILCKSSN